MLGFRKLKTKATEKTGNIREQNPLIFPTFLQQNSLKLHKWQNKNVLTKWVLTVGI